MAISSAIVTVTTTATQVAAGGSSDAIPGSTVEVFNVGSVEVRLGGPTVTTANGRPLAPGASWACDLISGNDALWAVAASTGSLSVLQIGV